MSNRNILWLDVETTGLDPTKDLLLEVGAFVTNSKLEVISHELTQVIYRRPDELALMDDFVRDMHTKTGLLATIEKEGIDIKSAEKNLYDFIRPFLTDGKIILAGSTVHFDKNFLRHGMPDLHEVLHYRIIDVSSFRETLEIVYGKTYPKKSGAHVAIEDAKQSFEDYKKYLAELATVFYDLQNKLAEERKPFTWPM